MKPNSWIEHTIRKSRTFNDQILCGLALHVEYAGKVDMELEKSINHSNAFMLCLNMTIQKIVVWCPQPEFCDSSHNFLTNAYYFHSGWNI